MIKCKGCSTYIAVSDRCALSITDVDNCPCYICLVKGMCHVVCDLQYDVLMKDKGKILKEGLQEYSTRRRNDKM